MTVVVGLVDSGAIWFGADARAEDDCNGRLLAAPKIWRRGPYLIGAAGSIRAANILRHCVKLPLPPKRGPERHVVTVIVPIIREAMKQAGYRVRSAAAAGGEDASADFLLAFNGCIFGIDGEFQVHQSASGFEAIGSGDGPALGALFASPELSPRSRIVRALEAAELFGVCVRRPWTILRLNSAAPNPREASR